MGKEFKYIGATGLVSGLMVKLGKGVFVSD